MIVASGHATRIAGYIFMPVLGTAVVVAAAVLAVVLLVVIARLVPAERREPHNDVIGFVYAVVGVVYAVVLAMVVIGVWDTLHKARTTTYQESDAVLQLYWYGRALPEPARGEIQDLAKKYSETVVNDEWPLLAHQQSSTQAWTEATALRDFVTAQQPTTLAGQSRYQQALDATATMSDARR